MIPKILKKLAKVHAKAGHNIHMHEKAMIIKRYLSSNGWVDDGTSTNEFDAYIDARRRCVMRGRPYVLFDDATGTTLSVLTVKSSMIQYGIDGDISIENLNDLKN